MYAILPQTYQNPPEAHRIAHNATNNKVDTKYQNKNIAAHAKPETPTTMPQNNAKHNNHYPFSSH